jgi:hypothetical protein
MDGAGDPGAVRGEWSSTRHGHPRAPQSLSGAVGFLLSFMKSWAFLAVGMALKARGVAAKL